VVFKPTVSCARELRVAQQDIRALTTWSPVALLQPGFPSPEPTALFRSDGKRPDGISLIPWQSSKSLNKLHLLAISYFDILHFEKICSLRLSARKLWATDTMFSHSAVDVMVKTNLLGVSGFPSRHFVLRFSACP